MKKGFTLLEMTVVMAVIALAAHLAVRELGRYRDSERIKAADRQLEDIRSAALAFFEDVGRLPRPNVETNADGEVCWTLSELWRKPASLKERRHIETEGVHLAAGWDGPYLRLPFGGDRLLDPWGNPMELFDSAGLRRLWLDKDRSVTNVCHYGSLAQETERRSISLLPDGGRTATLIISVNAGSFGGAVKCAWYGAFENSVTNAAQAQAAAGEQFVFEEVPCGTKFIKVTAGSVTVRQVQVKGPVTQIELEVQ